MAVGPRNATAASLLGFLHDGPLSGWDLVAVAQQLIGDYWTLTPSQVYRELARMADDGLVEVGPSGPRQRTPYVLTPAGRAAFSGWLDEVPPPETIRFPLLLRLAFGRHLPAGRRAEFLRSHRADHERRLAGYQEQHAAAAAAGTSADPFALATLQFGLAYERAVLAWFDGLSPEVAGSVENGSPGPPGPPAAAPAPDAP